MRVVSKFSRYFFTIGLMVFIAGHAIPVFAASAVSNPTATPPATASSAANTATININSSIRDISNGSQMKNTVITQQLGSDLEKTKQQESQVELDEFSAKKVQEAQPSFLDSDLSPLLDNAPSVSEATLNAKLKMDEMSLQNGLGYTTVEGISSTSDTNNFSSAAYMANEGYLLQYFYKMFCIPTSANASADCAASTAQATLPYENFIDIFVTEHTWSSVKALDVLLFARRFFAEASDKIFMGQGTPDAASFISDEGGLARANLRMAILNDIASLRAPTNKNAEAVGELLLETLAPTGSVKSLNYTDTCAQPAANLLPAEAYACSLSSTEADGTRIISKAAIDKIMQFDYMLSPDFYNKINSPAYSATGPIEKVQVYLKAQQLAQDYRALRLLQMKTLATAMNMMNAPKAP